MRCRCSILRRARINTERLGVSELLIAGEESVKFCSVYSQLALSVFFKSSGSLFHLHLNKDYKEIDTYLGMTLAPFLLALALLVVFFDILPVIG